MTFDVKPLLVKCHKCGKINEVLRYKRQSREALDLVLKYLVCKDCKTPRFPHHYEPEELCKDCNVPIDLVPRPTAQGYCGRCYYRIVKKPKKTKK